MRLTTPARIAWPARSGSVASHVEQKPESRARDHADGGDGRLGHRFADTPVFPGGPTPAPHMVQRTSIVEGIAMVTGLDRERERGGLLVDDDVEKLASGQMRKREFFPELRTLVHDTAERELRRVGRSAADCPYLEKWLAYYEGRPAAHLERALRRYARAATMATKALDYLAPVGEQLAQGIAAWARTGVMAGIPDELVDSPGDPGKLQSKARAGESPGSVDAGAIAAQLGPGRPIPDGVRGRMEDALDVDFAHVRIHTDGTTPRLAGELGARAFTVGHHVAFGADQFRPGDPAGDALLAHELAHVVQQGTGAPTGDVAIGEVGDPLEDDADAAAADAVAQLHGLGERPDEPRTSPTAGHGLRLQRCHTPPPPTKQPEPPRKDPIFDTYAAALAKLKQSAPETYELISALPLEAQGAFRTIRTVPWNLGAPAGTLTHNFQLRMDLVDAIPGEASTLAKFIGPGSSKNAASPELGIAINVSKPPLFIRYPMRILVTRAAASDTDRLEANLFHESIHMFRYMDRQLAERRADLGYPADAKEASPFQAPFARYESAARGTGEFDAVKKLFAAANAGSSTPGDADLAAAETEIVSNFLEEKFAYDTTVKRYGAKYGLTNAEIGSMYLDDLIQDRGWNVSAEDKGKMRKAIIDLLDAVDKALAPPP